MNIEPSFDDEATLQWQLLATVTAIGLQNTIDHHRECHPDSEITKVVCKVLDPLPSIGDGRQFFFDLIDRYEALLNAADTWPAEHGGPDAAAIFGLWLVDRLTSAIGELNPAEVAAHPEGLARPADAS